MKLTYYGDELGWATKLSHDFPQTFPADSVKNLGQAHKGGIESMVLFLAFLLELACCKNHVHRTSPLAEPALALREQALFQVGDKAVQHQSGKDFASN